MQPIAYGDSYGGVAQNALALDAARDARYFQSLADNRDRQREADTFSLGQQQLSQAAAEAQMRQSQNQIGNSLAQQQMQQQAYEAERNRQNELAVTNVRVSPYENKLDARTKLGVYQQVYQGINNGTIRTPGDLAASASGVLDPADMDRLAVALDGANSKMSTAFQNQQGNANRFNSDFATQVGSYYPAYSHAEALASAAPIAADLNFYQRHAPSFMGGVTPRETLQNDPAIGRYTSALSNFEAGLAKNRVAQSLQYDPSNPLHPFAPSMQAPPQLFSGGADSSDSAMPPVAPSAAAWQNPPGTNLEWHPDAMARLKAAMAAAPTDADKQAVYHQQLKIAEAASQVRPLSTAPNSLGLPTPSPAASPSGGGLGDLYDTLGGDWGGALGSAMGTALDNALPASW